MRMLVTGGAGFIGANFVHQTLREHPEHSVTVLDALTYAGNEASLAPVRNDIEFVHGSVADGDLVDQLAVRDVAHHELHPVLRELGQRLPAGGVGELVEDGHRVVGVGDDVVDEVGADEAGAAGDEELAHGLQRTGRRTAAPVRRG